MTEHEQHADQLESEVDDLERHSKKLGEDISDTQQGLGAQAGRRLSPGRGRRTGVGVRAPAAGARRDRLGVNGECPRRRELRQFADAKPAAGRFADGATVRTALGEGERRSAGEPGSGASRTSGRRFASTPEASMAVSASFRSASASAPGVQRIRLASSSGPDGGGVGREQLGALDELVGEGERGDACACRRCAPAWLVLGGDALDEGDERARVERLADVAALPVGDRSPRSGRPRGSSSSSGPSAASNGKRRVVPVELGAVRGLERLAGQAERT